MGVSFSHSFHRKLRDDSSIYFWTDQWLDGGKLCDLFPRLFALEQIKDCKINARAVYSNQTVNWSWSWRRFPRERESGELDSLLSLLSSVTLHGCQADSWSTIFAINGVFSVRETSANVDKISAFPCETPTIHLKYLPLRSVSSSGVPVEISSLVTWILYNEVLMSPPLFVPFAQRKLRPHIMRCYIVQRRSWFGTRWPGGVVLKAYFFGRFLICLLRKL